MGASHGIVKPKSKDVEHIDVDQVTGGVALICWRPDQTGVSIRLDPDEAEQLIWALKSATTAARL